MKQSSSHYNGLFLDNLRTPLTAKVYPSAQIMAPVFWDAHEINPDGFLTEKTFNAEYYSNFLSNDVRNALCKWKPGKLNRTVQSTRMTLENMRGASLPHSLYSSDLAPNYHLFGNSKAILRGYKFYDAHELKQVVRKWSRDTPKDFTVKFPDASEMLHWTSWILCWKRLLFRIANKNFSCKIFLFHEFLEYLSYLETIVSK